MENVDNITYDKVYFPGLHEKSFLHPTDSFALSAVKKMKGLDLLINAMNKISYEKLFRIQSMGDDVRVTKNTCKDIYSKVELCAKILNMPIPDVFINQSPFINAFATGTDSPMIQLYSGIIDYMDDQELLAVIAHEMGHIKCGHVLYHTAASALKLGTGLLGPLQIFTDMTFSLTLLEWERKSELSADRAALLVTQDIKPVIKVLMKMAGGSSKVANQIDYDDFIKQSKEYQIMSSSLTGRAYKAYLNLLRTHPFPVMRAAEIADWAQSDEYNTILKSGKYFEQSDKNAVLFDNVPINLHAISGRPKSIPIKWDIPQISNIIGYKIYRSRINTDFFQVVKEVSGRESNNFIDKNLDDGIEYYYYVTSIDAYNSESKESHCVSAITKHRPDKVSSFNIKSDKPRKAELTWEINTESESIIINIYRSINYNDKYKKIASIGTNNEKRFLDSGLEDDTFYSYYIIVQDEDLCSEPSNILKIKTLPLPDSPKQLISQYDSHLKRIHLCWEAVKEAMHYELYQKRLIVDKLIAGNITSNNFTISTELIREKKLIYYVIAIDDSERPSEKSDITVIEI